MIRTFDQAEVEELARFASVPVINGLTDLLHPCQVLADLFTVHEALGGWDGKARRLDRRRQQHGALLDRRRRRARASSCGSPARGVRSPTPRILEREPGPHAVRADRGSRRGGRRARTSSTPTSGRRWVRRTSRRSAAQRVQGLHRGRGADAARRPRRHLPPLPAGAPRRGSVRRGDRGAAVAGVGRGREPAARAEGIAWPR